MQFPFGIKLLLELAPSLRSWQYLCISIALLVSPKLMVPVYTTSYLHLLQLPAAIIFLIIQLVVHSG